MVQRASFRSYNQAIATTWHIHHKIVAAIGYSLETRGLTMLYAIMRLLVNTLAVFLAVWLLPGLYINPALTFDPAELT